MSQQTEAAEVFYSVEDPYVPGQDDHDPKNGNGCVGIYATAAEAAKEVRRLRRQGRPGAYYAPLYLDE